MSETNWKAIVTTLSESKNTQEILENLEILATASKNTRSELAVLNVELILSHLFLYSSDQKIKLKAVSILVLYSQKEMQLMIVNASLGNKLIKTNIDNFKTTVGEMIQQNDPLSINTVIQIFGAASRIVYSSSTSSQKGEVLEILSAAVNTGIMNEAALSLRYTVEMCLKDVQAFVKVVATAKVAKAMAKAAAKAATKAAPTAAISLSPTSDYSSASAASSSGSSGSTSSGEGGGGGDDGDGGGSGESGGVGGKELLNAFRLLNAFKGLLRSLQSIPQKSRTCLGGICRRILSDVAAGMFFPGKILQGFNIRLLIPKEEKGEGEEREEEEEEKEEEEEEEE